MQLILDADNIDIQRNMSTIEQETFSEKFLSDKVIDNLADDITTGNKENIQKQENIVQDVGEDSVVDTDKEITSSRTDLLTNNLSEEKCNEEKSNEEKSNDEKSNKDTIDTENVQTSEEIIDAQNIENTPIQNPEQTPKAIIIENVNNEESPSQHNELKLDESNNAHIVETKNESNVGTLDKDLISDVTKAVKDGDIVETPIELSKEDEGELDKEVDISELSSELNEEKEMDLDKEIDIAEVSTELSKENDIEVDETIDTIKEKELEKDSVQNEVPTTSLHDKSREADCIEVEPSHTSLHDKSREADRIEVEPSHTSLHDKSREADCIEVEPSHTSLHDKSREADRIEVEPSHTSLHDKSREADCIEVEPSHNNETNEKSDAIEIDDEDEKPGEQSVHPTQNVQNVDENVDKINETELLKDSEKSTQPDVTVKKASEESSQPKRICRLSNNLDIFSDEEDDNQDEEPHKDVTQSETEKQCINIDDDDDIMLIDEEDSGTKDDEKKDTNLEVNTNDTNPVSNDVQSVPEDDKQPKNEMDVSVESKPVTETIEEPTISVTENKDTIAPVTESTETSEPLITETNKMAVDKPEQQEKIKKPLLPKNFINTCKKNLADMTRNDLEEFCILKIVESIVDRSNLGEIKAHLKNLTQTVEECKKKCLMLSKQNKDLQVVLKSVQEEQKSGSDVHITPLKITRSVGMQVMMVAEKITPRKKTVNGVGPQTPAPTNTTKQGKTQQTQNTRSQKEKDPTNQPIPVPRLVPAAPPAIKTNPTNTINSATKQVTNNALPNGVRNPSPVQKVAEKRPRSHSVTVDLTDDEPPPKVQNVQRGPVNQQMRVITAPPNIMPAQRFPQNVNSPRKVYIPISGPQAQNVRPGQTIMLKALSGLGPRPRGPAQTLVAKAPQPQTPVRFVRGQSSRHPAPLPDAMKQYQPPNWKALPPAPDLKLSKVENGIVISWKIDGYQEDNHEEIASYQLYAYQETSSPPNTSLWKKIGDVKALPLPMACTLTQFMAGYKYYFAVRAVDIRSRFGPFSLPGSILLLNKM